MDASVSPDGFLAFTRARLVAAIVAAAASNVRRVCSTAATSVVCSRPRPAIPSIREGWAGSGVWLARIDRKIAQVTRRQAEEERGRRTTGYAVTARDTVFNVSDHASYSDPHKAGACELLTALLEDVKAPG